MNDGQPSNPSALEAGLEAANEFEVEGQLLTDVAGTLSAAVLSTPAMIAMMERTASMLVYPLLPPGKATVGFEVCVRHVRSAPEGSTCTAKARLEELSDGRKLRFSVEVLDAEGNTVGVGTHERRMVDVSS